MDGMMAMNESNAEEDDDDDIAEEYNRDPCNNIKSNSNTTPH